MGDSIFIGEQFKLCGRGLPSGKSFADNWFVHLFITLSLSLYIRQIDQTKKLVSILGEVFKQNLTNFLKCG